MLSTVVGHVLFGKACTKCHTSKPTEEFNKNKAAKDGKQSWCRSCHNNSMAASRDGDRLTWREYKRNQMRVVKDKVIAGYGGKCRCCEESTRVFLTLDHVEGGGRKARAGDSRGGNGAYVDALRQGFPPTYQVLCFNCNWAKHALGACPHQTNA